MLKRSLVILSILLGIGTQAPAENPNPGVFPPESRPFGATYNEWTARWWEFMVSIPAPSNPILDTTGADCGIGQSGPVWFLGGAGAEGISRQCMIPVGKAILFPVINAECSTAEFIAGVNGPDLAPCARDLINLVDSLSASVDGVPLRDLSIYRFQSPQFTFVIPPNTPPNPPDVLSVLDFGNPPTALLPAGPSPSVSDGFWIMLAPLSVGTHTITFHGTISLFKFAEGATVTVHIAP